MNSRSSCTRGRWVPPIVLRADRLHQAFQVVTEPLHRRPVGVGAIPSPYAQPRCSTSSSVPDRWPAVDAAGGRTCCPCLFPGGVRTQTSGALSTSPARRTSTGTERGRLPSSSLPGPLRRRPCLPTFARTPSQRSTAPTCPAGRRRAASAIGTTPSRLHSPTGLLSANHYPFTEVHRSARNGQQPRSHFKCPVPYRYLNNRHRRPLQPSPDQETAQHPPNDLSPGYSGHLLTISAIRLNN